MNDLLTKIFGSLENAYPPIETTPKGAQKALAEGGAYSVNAVADRIMNLDLIHHIAIIVSNYEVSKNFYVNILGFEIIRENYRLDRNSYKLDLKIGNSEIELFSMNESPKRLTRPEACGLRHLAFCVNNIEDVIIQKELLLNQLE